MSMQGNIAQALSRLTTAVVALSARSAGPVSLSEYTVDPVEPEPGNQWVLRSYAGGLDALGVITGYRMGQPMVLQAEIEPVSVFDLSVQTSAGIKRVRLA